MGMKGDLARFKITAEAIATEASVRHQYILADKLKTIQTVPPNAEGYRVTHDASPQTRSRKRNKKNLSDLFYLTMLFPLSQK